MLHERSSAPARPKVRVTPEMRTKIETLRRTRMSGQAIADCLAIPRSTIGRLSAPEIRPPIIRYEREKPGELIHIDTKKLGRIKGVGHRITDNRCDGKRQCRRM